MKYSANESRVKSILAIPKRYFVSSLIEKRRPLAPTAKRAGWVGSNILLSKIPKSGLVDLITDGNVVPKEKVLIDWKKTAFLDTKNVTARGWLIEVLRCVENIGNEVFTLNDIYSFEKHLHELYPQNQNVRPKIRQQLQVLRENGCLEFLGNGHYRLLI